VCTVMLNSSCLEQSGCLLNLYVMILYSHEAIFDLSFLYTSNSDPFYSLFFFFFTKMVVLSVSQASLAFSLCWLLNKGAAERVSI